VAPRVTDVERLRKQVRKMAAGRVLEGTGPQACRDLARMEGCRVCITAGYGPGSKTPQSVPHDRLLWILDGFVNVQGADGRETHVSHGESTVLAAGVPYRLVFPALTIYLLVEGSDRRP
jgi:hypothetical protein